MHTSVLIEAPQELAWKVLMDFEQFKNWNPLFRLIEGDMRVGGGLVETINLFGSKPVRWSSKIIELESPRKFAWRGHVWFKNFGEGEHHYEITPLKENLCRFDHWELFYGIIPNVIGPIFVRVAKNKFEEMNQAMKERVERMHKGG